MIDNSFKNPVSERAGFDMSWPMIEKSLSFDTFISRRQVIVSDNGSFLSESIMFSR